MYQRILLGLLLFISQTALAYAAPTVTVQIDPTSGTLRDSFVFSIEVKGAQPSTPPEIAASTDFDVAYIGPHSSIMIINGRVDANVRFNYRLIPKREGLLLTPAGKIDVEGTGVKINRLNVLISPEGTAPAATSTPTDENLFLRHRVDKTSVYLGEQIVSSLELGHRVPIHQPRIVDMSSDGFWQEDMDDGTTSRQYVNGKDFDVTRVRRALFPMVTGTLTLPPRKIALSAPESSKPLGFVDPFDPDIFDRFFGQQQMREVTLLSNPVTIEVRPLPPAPSGAEQWGLTMPPVGHTDLAVRYEATPVNVGESRTISVEVTSLGNISALSRTPLVTTRDYKVYPETPQSAPFKSGGNLILKKTINISVVPLRSGHLSLGTLSLPYFDPEERTYKKAETKEITLEVHGQSIATQSTVASTAAPASTAIHAPENGASPSPSPQTFTYRELTTLEHLSEHISSSLVLLLLVALGLLIYLVILMKRGAVKSAARNKVQRRVRDATSVPDLGTAAREWFAYRLGIEKVQTLSGEVLRALLREKVADKDRLFAALSALDDLEAALYGGTAVPLEGIKERILKV